MGPGKATALGSVDDFKRMALGIRDAEFERRSSPFGGGLGEALAPSAGNVFVVIKDVANANGLYPCKVIYRNTDSNSMSDDWTEDSYDCLAEPLNSGTTLVVDDRYEGIASGYTYVANTANTVSYQLITVTSGGNTTSSPVQLANLSIPGGGSTAGNAIQLNVFSNGVVSNHTPTNNISLSGVYSTYMPVGQIGLVFTVKDGNLPVMIPSVPTGVGQAGYLTITTQTIVGQKTMADAFFGNKTIQFEDQAIFGNRVLISNRGFAATSDYQIGFDANLATVSVTWTNSEVGGGIGNLPIYLGSGCDVAGQYRYGASGLWFGPNSTIAITTANTAAINYYTMNATGCMVSSGNLANGTALYVSGGRATTFSPPTPPLINPAPPLHLFNTQINYLEKNAAGGGAVDLIPPDSTTGGIGSIYSTNNALMTYGGYGSSLFGLMFHKGAFLGRRIELANPQGGFPSIRSDSIGGREWVLSNPPQTGGHPANGTYIPTWVSLANVTTIVWALANGVTSGGNVVTNGTVTSVDGTTAIPGMSVTGGAITGTGTLSINMDDVGAFRGFIDVYSKAEVDALFGGYYTKAEVDAFIADLQAKIDDINSRFSGFSATINAVLTPNIGVANGIVTGAS